VKFGEVDYLTFDKSIGSTQTKLPPEQPLGPQHLNYHRVLVWGGKGRHQRGRHRHRWRSQTRVVVWMSRAEGDDR